jgi:plasmid stabilization system protein ParE
MELIYHPRAAKDARDIAYKYADASEQVHERFWVELDEAVEAIRLSPERHHFDSSGLRRNNLKKFPYHILFEVRLEYIRVMVIRHHHRHPSYGMRRKQTQQVEESDTQPFS